MINKENYIEKLVDLLDGTLSPEEEEEVRLFLDQHPEIKKEVEGLSRMHLSPESPGYTHKESLKKSPGEYFSREELFEQYCLAYIEDDLDEGQRADFESFLESNPKKTREFELYQKTILQPGQHIQYPNKSRLKKYSLLRRHPTVLVAVSAAAAILVFAWLLLLQPQEYTKEQLVEQETKENIIPLEEESGEAKITTIGPDKKIRGKSPDLLGPAFTAESDVHIFESKTDNEKLLIPEMQKLQAIRITALSGQHEPSGLSAQVRRKTRTGTRELTLTAYLGKKMDHINNLPEQVDRDEDNAVIKALFIAGVDGLNRITGQRINIITGYNEQGNLINLGLESPVLAFNAPLRKKEE